MKIDVLVFAKPAQGCMCEVYWYPLELFLCAQIDQGDRTEAKPSLVFPTAMVVKVKQRGSKLSVAHTTTPKKARLYLCSLQLLLQLEKSESREAKRRDVTSKLQKNLQYAGDEEHDLQL